MEGGVERVKRLRRATQNASQERLLRGGWVGKERKRGGGGMERSMQDKNSTGCTEYGKREVSTLDPSSTVL